MKIIRTLFIVIFALFSLSCVPSQKTQQNIEPNPWDRYKPSSIKSIIEKHKASVNDTTILIIGKEFALLIPVVYLDSLRSIPTIIAEVVHGWARSRDKPKAYAFIEDVKSEVLVSEDGIKYWLPVQGNIAKEMKQYCTNGDTIKIYTQWFGAHRIGEDIDWVFVVNGFVEAEK